MGDIANVIIDVTKDDWPGEAFLVMCEVLEGINHSFSAMLFEDVMKLLWSDGGKTFYCCN